MVPGQVTTTNPQWGGRADLRIGGRSSDLLIDNQIPITLPQQINSFRDPATPVLPVRTLRHHCFDGVVRDRELPLAVDCRELDAAGAKANDLT